MLPEHDWIRYKIFNVLMRFAATAERSKDTWNHEKLQYRRLRRADAALDILVRI